MVLITYVEVTCMTSIAQRMRWEIEADCYKGL